MAKFGIEVAGLTENRASTYIRPGVVDDSASVGLAAVPGLIQSGVTAYEGLKKLDLRLEQNKNVEHLEQSIKSEELTKEMAPAISGIENIWDQFDSGADSMNAVNTLEKSLSGPKAAMAKLTMARDQGLLSDSEFVARNTAIVRASVSANPWMEAELYSQANTHLAALGITSLLSEREKISGAIAKKERDDYDFQMGRAKSYDLPWYQGMSMGELTSMVNKKAGELEGASNIKRFLDSGTQLSAIQSRQSVASGKLGEGIDLITNTMQEGYIAAIKADPKNYANIVADQELQGQAMIRQLRNTYGLESVQDGPVKTMIDKMETDTLSFYKLMRESGSGELSLKQAQNRTDFLKASQEFNFRDQYDPNVMDHALKFAQYVNFTRADMGDARYKAAIKSIVHFTDVNGVGRMGQAKAIESGSGVDLINIIGGKEGAFSNNTMQTTTAMVLNATEKYLAENPDKGKTVVDLHKATLATLASKAKEIEGSNVNPELTKSVGNAVGLVMKDHVPSMIANIKRMEATPANKGKRVIYDVGVDGYFVLKTGDPTSDDVVNKLYARDVNNALDSFAAVRKQPREKVALEFYQTYFDMLAKDTDLIGPDAKGAFPNTPEELRGGTTVSQVPDKTGLPETASNQTPLSKKELVAAPSREETVAAMKQAEIADGKIKAEKISTLTKEVSDLNKEVKASEAALSVATKRGSTDEVYLKDLKARVKKAKEQIGASGTILEALKK